MKFFHFYMLFLFECLYHIIQINLFIILIFQSIILCAEKKMSIEWHHGTYSAQTIHRLPPVLLKAHKCLFIKDFRYCFQNAAFYLAKDHLLKDKRLALESQKATFYNVG